MLHADVLGERARLSPDSIALVDVASRARFSYRDLDRRAQSAAGALCGTLGLRAGDRLGLLAHNRIEFIDLLFAAAKSGIILVPLSTRLTAHELEPIVSDSGMRTLIFDPALEPVVSSLRGRVTLDRWLSLPPVSSVPDRSDPDVGREWEEALEASAGRSFPRHPVEPEAPLALLYTSGTTGRPKGVVIPHRMAAWNAYNTAICWGLGEDDVSPVFTPLYHAGGLAAFMLPIIAAGGRIVLHRQFDVHEVWRTIVDEGCTVVLGVPTIWKLLMEAPEFETADLSRARWFISGGAPLPEFIARAYQNRGVVFKQGYGLTEVGVNCFSMTAAESRLKTGSIGKPLMMTEARIAGPGGEQLEAGAIGELWLRGPHVCAGYWNAPDATAAVLDADGWFHTGDMARVDADGFFYIAGRLKDMFISGGVNVYPAEIEGELLQHPAVADAAVVGAPDETWGEIGIAFVVRRAEVSAESLAEFLRGRLAKYKLPARTVFVEALPRTPYGKVVKSDLLRMYAVTADAGK
jgi:fatty-acyl-CoA synthase